MSRLINCFTLGVSLALAGAFAAPVMAQEFPSRVITLVVPFPAGGGGDTAGRFIADGLSETAGVPVIVENRPGGATLIGAEYVRNAEPDGYTLFLTSGSFVISSIMGEGGPYDPLEGLEPISFVSHNRFIYVTNPGRGFESMGDLIAFAKENPGELTYGNHGINTASDIIARDMAQQNDVDIRRIPYPGSAEANLAVMSGEIDFTTASTFGVLGHVNSGGMVPLGLVGDERDNLLPDVPTLVEQGLNRSDLSGASFGVSATGGTPEEIVQRLYELINEAFEMEKHKTRFEEAGYVVEVSTPQEFTDRILRESALIERFLD